MQIPNADKAIIAPEKIRDYLLNPAHRRGAPKARLLLACGYSAQQWTVLEADVRRQHVGQEVSEISDNEYGRCYVIVAPLQTPKGRILELRSVWQIDHGTDVPRLITMYPE